MGWKINKAPVGLLIYVEEFRILVNFFFVILFRQKVQEGYGTILTKQQI